MKVHVLITLVVLLAGCGQPTTDAPIESVNEDRGPGFSDFTAASGLDSFRHVTGASGKKWFPEAMGSGGGFLDFDGDGWQDVLLMGGGMWTHGPTTPARGGDAAGSHAVTHRALWLYRNRRGEAFEDVTRRAGLAGVDAYTIGMAAADYDNDGDQDVFVTTLRENLLFRNDGGVFSEIGAQAGVAGEADWSSSAMFFDADRDGDTDLYVGNYVAWSPETDIFCSLDGETKSYCTPETYNGVPSRFFRNNGDGTFTDATAEAGFLPSPGKTLGVTELDYNSDGWPDLMVANDTERDLLYENNRDGTFTERGAIGGVAYDENGRPRAGMGIDAGVVDNTKAVSLFVGNFSKEMIGIYRHEEDGLFLDRAAASQVGRPSLMTLTFGLFLFDVDLDTDLDLFAANGHVQPEIEQTQEGIEYAEAPHLFVNDGGGTFRDIAPGVGGVLSQRLVARGAAYADFDRDGDLDVLITENDGGAHLWRNEIRGGAPTREPSIATEDDRSVRTASPGYVRISLVGTESSRDGISARLIAVVDSLRMERRIRSGSSYLSQSELPATFGLGDARSLDTLVVQWPSGTVDRFSDIERNAEYRVIEGSGRLESVSSTPYPN